MTNLQHSMCPSLIAVCSFCLICWMKLNKQKLKAGFHTLFVVVDGNAWGAGIAQWLERQTRDRKVPGLSPGRNSGRIFFSRVNFLC